MSEFIGNAAYLVRENGHGDEGVTITGEEYMRRREAELGLTGESPDYGSMEDLREYEDFTLAQSFILFNKNGFDQSLLDPEIVKAAYWDAMAKYPQHLSEDARERAGEIIRSANAGQREREQKVQSNGYKVGAVALRDALVKGRRANEAQWMKGAYCLDADPDAFFPEKGGSTKEAKKICATCPVAEPCLDYALNNDERFGIWGGLSERERRRARRLREGAEQARPELKKAS